MPVCLNLTWSSLLDTYKYICTPWSCLLNLVSPQLRVVTVLLQVAQWKQTVIPSIYRDCQLCWWRKQRKKCRKLLSPHPKSLDTSLPINISYIEYYSSLHSFFISWYTPPISGAPLNESPTPSHWPTSLPINISYIEYSSLILSLFPFITNNNTTVY